MKINFEIIFKLFIFACLKFNFILSIQFCCCVYKKDPFRGFEKSSALLLSLETQEALEKDEIGNKILKLCYNKNGLPSYENIERIKKGNFKLDQKTCEKECSYLIIEMNEKFDIEQEENRIEQAKKLKERRRTLKNILNEKISSNIDNLYKGERCIIPVNQNRRKNSQKFKENLIQNIIKFETKINQSKNNSNFELEDFSFLSLSDEYNECIESDNQLSSILESNCKIEDVPNTHCLSICEDPLIDGDLSEGSIEKQIHNLDNQIIHLEKKNKRPINFILDRFTLPDEILVVMLKIFENTLDDTIRSIKNYFEDTVYFQFRIADRINTFNKKK